MTPVAAALLWDVRRAGEHIRDHVVGLSEPEYRANVLLLDSVERRFTIIGEALGILRRVAPDIAARIPVLAEIVAFRHVLVHGYRVVDHARVWQIIQHDLPPLLAAVDALLSAADP